MAWYQILISVSVKNVQAFIRFMGQNMRGRICTLTLFFNDDRIATKKRRYSALEIAICSRSNNWQSIHVFATHIFLLHLWKFLDAIVNGIVASNFFFFFSLFFSVFSLSFSMLSISSHGSGLIQRSRLWETGRAYFYSERTGNQAGSGRINAVFLDRQTQDYFRL